MRVDVVSIFPEYLAPLELSLVGKARERGLVDLHVHDLRDWTHDRHRTVDDTPYGGGAGMVMRPEPWGEALDAVSAVGARRPTGPRRADPAGTPFDQASPSELAPGRVAASSPAAATRASTSAWSTTPRTRIEVREVSSLGDYVLNGGEVAALVMIEAVARLAARASWATRSRSRRSRTDRRGRVPACSSTRSTRSRRAGAGSTSREVLLSGDHARIAAWRHDQARRRTAARRPDLLTPPRWPTPGSRDSTCGSPSPPTRRAAHPAARLLGPEAQDNELLWIPPLTETLDDVRRDLGLWTTLDAHERRAARRPRSVAPAATPTPPLGDRPADGGRPTSAAVASGGCCSGTSRRPRRRGRDDVQLFTGARSADNLRMYKKAGYRLSGQPFIGSDGSPDPAVVRLDKRRR